METWNNLQKGNDLTNNIILIFFILFIFYFIIFRTAVQLV